MSDYQGRNEEWSSIGVLKRTRDNFRQEAEKANMDSDRFLNELLQIYQQWKRDRK
jgi:hypothetical protein